MAEVAQCLLGKGKALRSKPKTEKKKKKGTFNIHILLNKMKNDLTHFGNLF
jgi:hypothetical protein